MASRFQRPAPQELIQVLGEYIARPRRSRSRCRRLSTKRRRHSQEEGICKLRQADAELAAGQSIAGICQKLQISEQIFHHWRNRYGGMKANDARRLLVIAYHLLREETVYDPARVKRAA